MLQCNAVISSAVDAVVLLWKILFLGKILLIDDDSTNASCNRVLQYLQMVPGTWYI